LLPSAAIQRNSQTTYVYVVKPDQTTSIRNVTIGTTDGDNSEVTSGLSPGEVVVMTGVDKLIEGGKVKVHMDANQSGSSGK
jgi:membrane fusion protein, multidrug efflux system